ncbi:MAG: hypothetical protein ACLUEQ_05810 [Cloacibacillus evryensis]
MLIERCGLRGEEPLFYLMLSPAIGAAFWLGTTLFLGITFSYGKPLLLLCSAALIIYLCRFHRDIGIKGALTKGECSVLLLILAAALLLFRSFLWNPAAAFIFPRPYTTM